MITVLRLPQARDLVGFPDDTRSRDARARRIYKVRLADIAQYAYVHCAEEGGFCMAEYTALNAWLRRVEARPAHIGIDELPDGSRAGS